jgi:ABC-type multidrug transport system fused ATPase/permease subunit
MPHPKVGPGRTERLIDFDAEARSPALSEPLLSNIVSEAPSSLVEVEEECRRQAAARSSQPLARRGSEGGTDLDIVQFAAPIFFVEEQERILHVDVMRLGSMHGVCSVQWASSDASAKAGKRYKAASGQVVFEDGEDTKSVSIDIINDSRWSTTLEFKLTLTDPINCELGKYLHSCRVKVIDNDLFPSSVHRDKIKEGIVGIEQIPIPSLFWEYFKLNASADGIGKRMLAIVLLSQLENIYVFFNLYMQVYFVDVLFNTAKPEESEPKLYLSDRRHTGYLIGLMFILPMFLLHLVDVQVAKMDLEGMSREFIQHNLFRKYLNFGEKTREDVTPSHMQVALLRDTGEVVEGCMAVLELIKSCSKLLILVAFILKENTAALLPVMMMPSAMFIFVMVRTEKMIEASERVNQQTAALVEVVQEACMKYTVIAEYMQRPAMCDVFEHASEQLSAVAVPADVVKVNNNYFPKWLGPLFIGGYVVYSVGSVLDGQKCTEECSQYVSLGTFLATLRIFKELSEEFAEMYKELMTIAGCSGALRKLTFLLNLPTDAPMWKRVNRERRRRTKDARKEILANAAAPQLLNGDSADGAVAFRSDLIPLKCVNMTFGYNKELPVLKDVNVSVQQGQMVAIVGDHGSGKRTFLRILGHFLFPDAGHVLIPTYLRILHVSQDPVLLGLSAWKNLTFGHPHADPERVKNILDDLGMTRTKSTVVNDLKTAGKAGGSDGGSDDDCPEREKESEADWQKALNYVEVAKIHLARALVVNSEILVLQRPLIHYDEQEGDRIAKVIKKHVENRGLQLAEDSRHRRRPRTCFYTPSTIAEAKDGGDVWWRISDKSVTQIRKDELQASDLSAR